jgi:hypothetical protein
MAVVVRGLGGSDNTQALLGHVLNHMALGRTVGPAR